MIGTLDSHAKIANALGIDVTELYRDLKGNSPATGNPAASAVAETFSYNDKASYEILATNILSKKMLPLIVRIEPGGQTSVEQNQPSAEKFIFVMAGEISVQVGEQIFSLKANDTLYFKASLKHFVKNTGGQSAKFISVVSPVAL